MASATRTIRVRFDGSAKGLIKAAAEAGIAVEGFEKQANKSTKNLAKEGGGIGGGMLDALGSLPSQLKGAAIVAAVGIGTVMAPALASAIISGVLLVVGGGALATGIIGAARNPKVQAAWKKFGRQATVMFEQFSKPFIKPMIRAARTFGFALARMGPTITRIGAAIAPVVDKLAPALAGFFENFVPGILTAVQASVPLFDTLAANLPGIGTALAGFFSALAAGVPIANRWFGGFLKWVQDILPKLGGVITWVAELGPKFDAFGAKLAPLKDALATVGDYIMTGMREAREMLSTWLEANREKLKRFIEQVSSFISDTGPAFRISILAIALVLASAAENLMFFVDQLDRLKRWYNANKSWLQAFTILPIATTGGAELGRIPGRAGGGGVTQGRSYLVGEKGRPEIFTAGASGYITPLDKMDTAAQSTWGPMVIENHIEIGGEVVRVVRTEISASNRATKRAVLAGAGAR